MKIERDKVYLTRNGEHMRIICTDSPVRDYPVIGIDYAGTTFEYAATGQFHHGDGNYSRLDLVSEYVEPPKPREVWVSIDKPDYAGPAYFPGELETLTPNPEYRATLVKFREVIEA